jgi:putative acetyltransferase
MSLRIRDLTVEDLPVVHRLIEQVLAEYGFSTQVGGIEQDLREARERYGGGRAGFWVGEVDGEIVGSVAIRPKWSAQGTCELKRLYLLPGQRGRGVGQALYDHAEAFARAAGYERLWLDSSRRFTKAHRLYQRNGFVLLEHIDNDWEDDVYEKSLGPVLTPA